LPGVFYISGSYHSSLSSSSPPSSSPPPPSSPRPPPHPARQVTCTVKGQNYADTIRIRDEQLAARQLKAPHPQQTLSAVSDFISFFATDDLLNSEFMDDLDLHEPNVISSFFLLTSVDRLHFQRTPHYDLCKAPESFHEALA